MTFKNYLDSLKGKRVAVVGAGISNTPLIEALLASDIDTTVCDNRNHAELGPIADRFEALGAKFSLGERYLDGLHADVIFRTPGMMPSNPALMSAVAGGAVLTSEMEVFFDVCPCKTIGITGSDGKTTTTSIIGELLKNEGRTVHVGGNIGTPLLSIADEMQPDDIAVLELSSFQLITMQKCPDIAVVTNLAPNHLDVHSDMDEYVRAKRNIYINQTSTNCAVFNLDNDYTRNYAGSAPGKVRFFSRKEKVIDGAYLENGMIYEAVNGKSEAVMTIGDILLPGMHNVENYLAAISAVQGLVSHETMLHTAKTFQGVSHRIELVRELHGIRYYNDSIASSPSRTIAGLRSFDKKVILIAGGKDKGVAFDELGAEIISKVKTLVLIGVAANQIRDAVINTPGFTGAPEMIMCDGFKEAVLAATKAAQDGDIVLLSPACTSFDMFKNFEERGETFRSIVNEL